VVVVAVVVGVAVVVVVAVGVVVGVAVVVVVAVGVAGAMSYTDDEKRAWDRYAAAALANDWDIQRAVTDADAMLSERRKRFPVVSVPDVVRDKYESARDYGDRIKRERAEVTPEDVLHYELDQREAADKEASEVVVTEGHVKRAKRDWPYWTGDEAAQAAKLIAETEARVRAECAQDRRTGQAFVIEQYTERLSKAEAERDALRAKVEGQARELAQVRETFQETRRRMCRAMELEEGKSWFCLEAAAPELITKIDRLQAALAAANEREVRHHDDLAKAREQIADYRETMLRCRNAWSEYQRELLSEALARWPEGK